MKKIHIWTITVGLALLSLTTSAQPLVQPKDFNNQSRIALIDEFFSRFNGEELSPFADKRKPDYLRTHLLTLFDMSAYQSKTDPRYLATDSLITQIIDTNQKIHYEDTAWLAIAPCRATLRGKATKLSLALLVESRGDDMYKWVIANATGDFAQENQPSRDLMLLPNDHETNFISLHRMTADTPQQSESFAQNGYKRDVMTTFFTLIRYGLLKIEAIEGLRFMLFQIPNYVLTISYIDRESHNSGWLITSFEKMNETDKKVYYNTLISNR